MEAAGHSYTLGSKKYFELVGCVINVMRLSTQYENQNADLYSSNTYEHVTYFQVSVCVLFSDAESTAVVNMTQ